MSFFTTSDNQTIQSQGQFELGGSEPLPDNTQVIAAIDEAKWDDFDGDRFISLRWTVLDGEFKGRKVFQKVRVLDADTKRADKAKMMLAAIDTNAGGALMAAGVEPDDVSLSINLTGKPMMLLLGVWELNGGSGNWVKKVSASGGTKPAQQAQQTQEPSFDEDIGF